MKILTLLLTGFALTLAPVTASAADDHKKTKECQECCKSADKCDACCHDKGKGEECKECCGKPKEKGK